jgi:hypothetical protein
VARDARHLTFSGDDWTVILHRRGINAGVFLEPHNEHLTALPILAYKLLLELFGARSYAPFMALLLLVHGIACLLLYALARRYVGPWAALAPSAVLVVLGPAWQDLLWAFQVGYLGSVATGLGTVLCLERRDRRGDVAAAALLVISLLCSSIGLAMLVLAAVLLALQRPRAWRRVWVVGLPLALYAVWYAVYGVSTARSDNIVRIPRYLAQALSAALASVTGVAQTHISPYLVSTSYGRFIAVGVVVLLIVHFVRGGRLPPLAWAASAAAVALWLAQCLSYFPSGREAAQSRYQYAAAALVLLALTAAAAGWRPTLRTGLALGVATVAVCAANISMLHGRADFWTENSRYTAAETGVMEVARGVVVPDFAPENLFTAAVIGVHNLQPISARPYFSAVDAFGSAADDQQAILHRPERVREAADLIVAAAERLRLDRDGSVDTACGSAHDRKHLDEVVTGPGALTVCVGRGGLAELQLRRFASSYRYVRFRDMPGGTLVLRLPRDRSRIPWHARAVGQARLWGPAT